MNESFYTKIYEETRKYELWERSDEYDTFQEAENGFSRFRDKMKQNGIIHHFSGGERDVYKGIQHDGHEAVLKIARTGIQQNRRAINAWRTELSDEAKSSHIAPLLGWSDEYKWMLQARADGRGDVQDVAQHLSEHNLSVPDLNGENVGVHEGESVLIDLGKLQ